MNVTILDRIIRKLFKIGVIPARLYMILQKKRLEQEWLRCFGSARIDVAIQFSGYEDDIILLWSIPRKKMIYVHADMLGEIKTKGNQRLDVLRYSYRRYDKVALVTQGMYLSTQEIARQDKNFCVCHNVIDDTAVWEKSLLPMKINTKITEVYPSADHLSAALASDAVKFINVGRFSPEKGQLRLIDAYARTLVQEPNSCLIIMGGYTVGNCYDIVRQHIEESGLEDRVILIQNLPNPFPVIKKCDYFVLSSFYEGFGLVLAEADILGKPVISTDIRGPRAFMQEHGGTLVENSEEGLYQGMLAMLAGKIQPMNVDYDSYNKNAIQEFEQLLSSD